MCLRRVLCVASLLSIAACRERAPLERADEESFSALRDRFVYAPLGEHGARTPVIERSTTSFASSPRGLVPRIDGERAKTILPTRANQRAHVEDVATKMAVDFRLRGARDVAGTTADGSAFYPRGGPEGSHVVQRPSADATEDYVIFEKRPTREEISYDVELTGVLGLRLIESSLELLDARGTPRLRIAPPSITEQAGKTRLASLTVEGCAVDTDPRAPWDRPVTSPGSNACVVRVGWQAESYPVLVDPSWLAAGTMASGRDTHVAALLGTGKVLVAGGYGSEGELALSELYDPATNTWAATGAMNSTRSSHAFAVLGNGKVLVTGGTGGANGDPLSTSELYDPATGKWTATGSMGAARNTPTTTLLADGKVLVIGGGTTSAELYNPANGAWATTGAMGKARTTPLAARLKDGKVLAAAGSGDATAEIYNPLSGQWAATGSMSRQRFDATMTALADGRVFVVGGAGDTGEIFDPAMSIFIPTGTMGESRSAHTATLLASGKVLVSGGSGSAAVRTAEIFDPATGKWLPQPSMSLGRSTHTATVLPNGMVLFAGGRGSKSAELFLLINGDACTAKNQCASDICVDGVCCDKACTGSCEACAEPTTKGTCSVVSGKPRGERGACGDGTPCGPNQCDGKNPARCLTFPPAGTPCGCTNNSSLACTGVGECRSAGPCANNLTCDGTTQCKAKCTVDTDCTIGFQCNPDGTCVPGAKCLDERTSQAVDGKRKTCTPYKCGGSGSCLTTCASVADCESPSVCDSNGACVPADGGAAADGDGGGCEVAASTGNYAIVILGITVLTLRTRRRRGHTSSSRSL